MKKFLTLALVFVFSLGLINCSQDSGSRPDSANSNVRETKPATAPAGGDTTDTNRMDDGKSDADRLDDGKSDADKSNSNTNR